MNRQGLISNVATLLREKDVRKSVSFPKQVFHISDDDGTTKDFVFKKKDKNFLYTKEDVMVIVDAIVEIAEDAMKRGEPVTIAGFGSLRPNYRKPRSTKNVKNGEDVFIPGHYTPKFYAGKELKRCARVYEMMLADKLNDMSQYADFDIDDEEGDGEVDG